MISNLRDKCPPEKMEFAKLLRKNMTLAERFLWGRLRCHALGVKFRRQAVIRGYVADFWCPSEQLVVEVDGPSHIGREAYDAHRDAVMQRLGIRVLRFSNNSVFNEMDLVLSLIALEFHAKN